MIATATPPEPAFSTGLSPYAGTLPSHISPTAAKNYLSCSLRFWFEKVACIRKPVTPALHLGKAVHAALQAFHLARWRGTDDSPEAVAAAFDQAFHRLERDEGPVRFDDDTERQKNRRDGLRVVAAYLDSPEVLRDKPRAVEVLLREDIPGLSVPLTGAMDLVEGNFTPVDFKSAAAKPDPAGAAFDHEIQLVSYQLLMEAATGVTPPSLDLVFLVKTKVPQVIRVSSPPADAHRKRRVTALLETAVCGIADNRHHPAGLTAVRQWVMAQMARRFALSSAGMPRRNLGRKRRSTSMTVVPMSSAESRCQWWRVSVGLTGHLAAELLHQLAAVLLGAVGQMHVDHGGVDVLVAHQRLDGEDGRSRFGKMSRETMTQRINTLLTNSAW